MIRLAVRLGLGGGKESVVRHVVTALGVALGAALLLFTSVAFPALQAHDQRGGWTQTSAQNARPAQDEATTDPLLWRVSSDRFEGRRIVRVDVAALGPHAPVPPGLSQLPGPGQFAASPALQRLVQQTPANQLGDRFPGRLVATVGPDALTAPDDLVVVVGHAPADLQNKPFVRTVRSIESKPISHSETRFARVVLFIGGVGLLVPIIVFVSTATRLAAARREQRLAALRLAGATPGQTNAFAAVEAAIAAVAGVVVGFGVFSIGRPYVARIPFDGSSFYPSDLRLSIVMAVVVAVGVPAVAMAAALVSLRGVRVSPLGVSRVVRPTRPTSRRLLILAGGLALFLPALLWASRSHSGGQGPLVAVAAAFTVVVLGVFAAGPWLTGVVAGVIGRLGRTPPVLLASRRLQHDPKAAFRAIGGLTLAVFMSSVFSGLASSALADARGHQQLSRFAADMLTAMPSHLVEGGVSAAVTNRTVQELASTTGVTSVVDLRALPADVSVTGGPPELKSPDGRTVEIPVALLRCRDAALMGLPPCDGTVAVAPTMAKFRTLTFTLSRPVATRELDGLPLMAIGVGTDGGTVTVERARTIVESLAPGTEATTGAEDDAQNADEIHIVELMSNVGLSFVLLVAGCSLAVAVAGGLVERKRPFALLRLSGMRLRELHQVVLTEAGGPLLVVAAASAVLGLAVAAMILAVVGAHQWRWPGPGYWAAMIGGLATALAVVAATLPLLDRLTALESARFE